MFFVSNVLSLSNYLFRKIISNSVFVFYTIQIFFFNIKYLTKEPEQRERNDWKSSGNDDEKFCSDIIDENQKNLETHYRSKIVVFTTSK